MAGFEYHLIGSDDIRDAFQLIKGRLEACRAKAKFRPTVEDVYHVLKDNRSNLVLLEFQSEIYGFALIHPQIELGTDERELFIWLLEQDNIPGAMEFFADAMEEIARSHNCVRTIFQTRRPGYLRGGYEQFGFKPVANMGVAEYGRR